MFINKNVPHERDDLGKKVSLDDMLDFYNVTESEKNMFRDQFNILRHKGGIYKVDRTLFGNLSAYSGSNGKGFYPLGTNDGWLIWLEEGAHKMAMRYFSELVINQEYTGYLRDMDFFIKNIGWFISSMTPYRVEISRHKQLSAFERKLFENHTITEH